MDSELVLEFYPALFYLFTPFSRILPRALLPVHTLPLSFSSIARVQPGKRCNLFVLASGGRERSARKRMLPESCDHVRDRARRCADLNRKSESETGRCKWRPRQQLVVESVALFLNELLQPVSESSAQPFHVQRVVDVLDCALQPALELLWSLLPRFHHAVDCFSAADPGYSCLVKQKVL